MAQSYRSSVATATGPSICPRNWRWSAASSSVAAGDFNRDGRPDLAIGEEASQGGTVAEDLGRVRVFLNDGAGNFALGVAYDGVSAP